MNKKFRNTYHFEVIFIVALFSLFAYIAMLTVTAGANSYRDIVSHMDKNYFSRTLTAYINEKIRHSDAAVPVQVIDYGNTCLLVLNQNYEDSVYSTCIYEYNGSLREITVSSMEYFSLSGGQEVFSATGFHATFENDNLLKISVTDVDGVIHNIYSHVNTT